MLSRSISFDRNPALSAGVFDPNDMLN